MDICYNLGNRPVSLTRTGEGTQVSCYLYNALEQLVQRSTSAPGGPAGAVQYLYGLDGSPLAEADAATGRTLREYIWLPQDDASPAADNDNEEGAEPPPLPLALVTGVNTATPALLMVHADHLNRPTRLTDAARATVWQASYDPFGQPVSITGTVEQNLRFPGQYFLIESGMAYNWHRIYDPATGRYTQPDPLRFVDGPSVYGYVGQSPLMRVDREGRNYSGYRPPPNIPGGPWVFSPDPRNPRGGTWTDSNGNSVSWDQIDDHWDFDDCQGNRQRYNRWGSPLSPDEAHGGYRGPKRMPFLTSRWYIPFLAWDLAKGASCDACNTMGDFNSCDVCRTMGGNPVPPDRY